MKDFAALLDRLIVTPQRGGKLALMAGYFRAAPDPDRGWALAALAGALELGHAKPALLRALIAERTDPVLFALSYDYVGDLAETCALLWPDRAGASAPELSHVIEALRGASKPAVPGLIATWLDGLDATGRWALLKLVTGGMRVGASAALAKAALAQAFALDVAAIEEIWHAQAPPYAALFAWGEGRAPRPADGAALRFRPFMLAQPLENPADLADAAWQAEWKWDGVRVQLVRSGGAARLYSRGGDDISTAFPDLVDAVRLDGALDGELLIRDGDGGVAPFSALQQRLNRKAPRKSDLADYPAFLRAYDLLAEGSVDWRGRPLADRRARLAALVAAHPGDRLDLSEVLPVGDPAALADLQSQARALGREGLMLKRRDAPYRAGREKGLWYKWKRDPLTADAVLMYAQRGHGKRSSFYSDYTFGVWRGAELVPVGKAYSGFTDAELIQLDKFVRERATERFGPVRAVEPALVLEVAFDSVQRSSRHKSGLALRFPRIARIRWDKPVAEADRIETLEALLDAAERP